MTCPRSCSDGGGAKSGQGKGNGLACIWEFRAHWGWTPCLRQTAVRSQRRKQGGETSLVVQSVVKSLLCNAGDAGSIPSWGIKIPQAAGRLNPRVITREPTCGNF